MQWFTSFFDRHSTWSRLAAVLYLMFKQCVFLLSVASRRELLEEMILVSASLTPNMTYRDSESTVPFS